MQPSKYFMIEPSRTLSAVDGVIYLSGYLLILNSETLSGIYQSFSEIYSTEILQHVWNPLEYASQSRTTSRCICMTYQLRAKCLGSMQITSEWVVYSFFIFHITYSGIWIHRNFKSYTCIFILVE